MLPLFSSPSLRPNVDRCVVVAALAALAALFVLHAAELTFVDPDLFHEMALARETVTLGYLPVVDHFAYTPTVDPSVHHEWGTGMLLYGVATTLGATGLMTFKYLLALGVWAACIWCARRRGASFAVIVSLAPVTILAGVIGYTTIRAQLFTLLFMAVMLAMLADDERGGRRWVWLWLPLYVVWVNLHAGFVVGAGLMAGYAIEQWLRGRDVRRFAWLGAAMAALVIVNPYGWRYYPYLADALTMDRPLITEWQPLWQTDPRAFQVFLATLILAIYPLMQLGWRRLPGLVVFSLATYAACRHTRHLSVYLVVWMCYVPAWVQMTRLGRLLDDVWQRRRGWVLVGAGVLTLVCLVQAAPARPWQLTVPARLEDERSGLPLYPVGAVAYLDRQQFVGNVMVPFTAGGYVSWKLHPRVKVSIDGRYEVAYQPGVLEENVAFYDAKDGWQQTLAKYPTDLVLTTLDAPVAAKLAELPGWQRVYQDAAFAIYARPGLSLPAVTVEGEPARGVFP